MNDTSVFKRGFDFPNEGFIQMAVEKYFSNLGYHQIPAEYSDYVCEDVDSKEKWVIEAKGMTTQMGLDFRTCLGQLVQRMDSQNTKYGIALPNTIEYRNQCKMVKQWVRKALNIYWLFFDEKGVPTIYTPDDILK